MFSIKRVILIIVALQLGFGNQSMAQDAQSTENFFFQSIRTNQTESYILLSHGLGNLEPMIFEGLLSPNFLLRVSSESRWGATLSPAVLLRMFAEESYPVRAPSYMPQMTFYHLLGSKQNREDRVHYIFLTVAHHSNGQEDPFYHENGSININSGDFSTNYFEIGTFFNKQISTVNNAGEHFRTSIEIHPDFHRSEELEGRYSFVRWHNNFRIFRYPSNWKLDKQVSSPNIQTTLKTTWMFGEIDDAPFFNAYERLNVSLTINYHPQVLNDVSLFVNFYTGKDYYNMQFDRRIAVFRLGLQVYSIK